MSKCMGSLNRAHGFSSHLFTKNRGVAFRPCTHATSPAPDCLQTENKASQAKKVAIVSLGCPKNTVDGEVMLGDLFKSGFDIIERHEEADAIIVNTCGFIEDAKTESIEAILSAAKLKGNTNVQRVVVTGCLAQRYASDLAESLPEADAVVGFSEYSQLPATLSNLLGVATQHDGGPDARTSRVMVGGPSVPFRPEWGRHRLTPRHYAYLRVAEGCNHACTFCAIPSFRGKFRSKPWDQVLEEAKYLVASGVIELNLIAEDTNHVRTCSSLLPPLSSLPPFPVFNACGKLLVLVGTATGDLSSRYGQDFKDGPGLAELLRELAKLDGLRWIRILYAYPSYFTDELIAEIANNPKVCKYIDIPLQHINNLTLLSMNRPPQDHTVKLLRKLRERIPGLALRTTFISGFPGESADAHSELLNFCKDFAFERMGCFTFSEEEGTAAASFPEQIPLEVREARRDELLSQQQMIGEHFARSIVGQEIDVLVDDRNEEGELLGRTQWDAPDVDPFVFLTPSPDASVPPLVIGQIRRCRITSTSVTNLEAVPVT